MAPRGSLDSRFEQPRRGRPRRPRVAAVRQDTADSPPGRAEARRCRCRRLGGRSARTLGGGGGGGHAPPLRGQGRPAAGRGGGYQRAPRSGAAHCLRPPSQPLRLGLAEHRRGHKRVIGPRPPRRIAAATRAPAACPPATATAETRLAAPPWAGPPGASRLSRAGRDAVMACVTAVAVTHDLPTLDQNGVTRSMSTETVARHHQR